MTDQALVEDFRTSVESGRTARVIELIKSHGVSPLTVVDNDGQTALHLAAAAGHNETVEALIEAGCDVSIQDFTGHTALQRASAEGHVEIIKLLLKNGASVDHQDEVHGNTALHEAAWKGFSQSVQVLGKAKANPYIKNRGGFAPLHLCCQNGHNETCRVLLLGGCKPDIKNNYGDTPLHTSGRYGHAGVIRILVSAHCNVSEQNKNGDTALHIAAAMGRRKLTRILLESGCDKDMKNKQEETALDISRRKNLVDIIHIIENPPPLIKLNTTNETDETDVDGIRRDKSYSPTRGILKQPKDKTSLSSREEKSKKPKHKPEWSPYGCHYQPQPEEFPTPNIETLPHDPLRPGEQYFSDLAGNIKKGPITPKLGCYCNPAFQKLDKRLAKDKRDLLKQIDLSHQKLDLRIANLERKTKDQVFHLNQTMKETFAHERGECLDRMDRRALRERIAIERQQVLRDVALKRDLAAWLESKLQEIEKRHNLDDKNKAVLRAMAMKRFARHHRGSKRSNGSRKAHSDQEFGTLRRAQSEELLSEVSACEDLPELFINRNESKPSYLEDNVYKGLKVSDRPQQRVRRNSAGDEIELLNDLHLMGESPLATSERLEDSSASEMGRGLRNVYYPMNSNSHSPASSKHHDYTNVSSSDRASSTVSSMKEMTHQSPEQRLDFVCDAINGNGGAKPKSAAGNRHHHHQNPSASSERAPLCADVIRPIPGRPGHHGAEQGRPGHFGADPGHFGPDPGRLGPDPGRPGHIGPERPPPNRPNGVHRAQPAYVPGDDEEQYKRELHSVQRQLFPANHMSAPPLVRPQSYPAQTRVPMMMRPMLAPLDEDDYVTPDKDGHDLHRQLLSNIPMTSDGAGSHDSHNDSGYSTRLGFSAGPSPSLSGSRPGSRGGGDASQFNSLQSTPLLDPMAINLMPPEMERPTQHFGGAKIHELKQKLQLDAQFGPKGSLV